MRALLTVTAVLEVAGGVMMVVSPSLLIMLMFGTSVNTPVELSLARAFGVALLALAVACWLARTDEQSQTQRSVVGGMLVFEAGVVLVLAYAGVVLELSGILLWVFVLTHAALAVWCVIRLLKKPEPVIAQVK